MFKMKLGAYINLNILNQMLMFICPVLNWKYITFVSVSGGT